MRWILFFAVAGIVATGCQTSPRVSRHIEALNSEKRILEDELYELEYEYEDALAEIDQLRTENERLNRRLGVLPSSPSSSSPAPRRTDSTRKSRDSNLELAPPKVEEGMLEEPKVEIPDQKPSRRETPKAAPAAPAVPMSFHGPLGGEPTNTNLLSLVPPELYEQNTHFRSAVSSGPERQALDPADPRITHIFLDPLFTGGSDFDREPGDDGVVVSLEPRNQENRFVPLAGPLSVVILDPTQEEQAARVARWDLEATDVEQAIRASSTGSGIRLKLPWPNGAPENNRLQLFVRYETVDGRRLEASREIFVTLPGQFSQRWTPRSSGRTRVLAARETSKLPSDVQAASHARRVDGILEQNLPSAASHWQPER